MTDKEFCAEFVKRLKNPPKTVSALHLIDIVLRGIRIPLYSLYSDIYIERLFTGDNVYQDVYKYVRDHQEEFVQS